MDGRSMYAALQNDSHTEHTEIIRLTNIVQSLRNDTYNGIQDVSYKFSQLMVAQRDRNHEYYESFERGELRTLLFLANSIHETARLADTYEMVLNSCQNKKLPLSLIPADTLTTELKALSAALDPLQQELVTPIKNLSPYYHLPLVNCHFFGNNNSVTVILHIPIQPVERHIALHEVITIPFKQHQEICQFSIPSSFIILLNNRPLAIENTISHNCQPEQGFCRFREYGSTNPELFCLGQLLRGASHSTLRQFCNFKCRPSTGYNDIHVTDLGHQHFALTNTPPDTTISCHLTEGTMTQEFVKPNDTLGSHFVTLPCRCVIIIPQHTVVIINSRA